MEEDQRAACSRAAQKAVKGLEMIKHRAFNIRNGRRDKGAFLLLAVGATKTPCPHPHFVFSELPTYL
jgi:hypothetical protein